MSIRWMSVGGLLVAALVSSWWLSPPLSATRSEASRLAAEPRPATTADSTPSPEPVQPVEGASSGAPPSDELQLRAKAEEGARLFASRRFAEAAVLLVPAAEAGYPQAQYQVGWMHYMGIGLPRDLEAAVGWFTRAAERGEASGMNALGTALREGKGTDQDHATALRWYRAAAEQAHPEGEVNLGFMYEMGYGAEKDPTQAARWYSRAAAQNHATAQFYLASLYEEGKGVERDPDTARGWYRRAAAQGNEYARLALKRLEGRADATVPNPAAGWAGER